MSETGKASTASRPRWRKKRWWTVVAFAGLLIAAWFSREDIANNVIADELQSRGIPATYEVERIGGRRQVFTNVVLGDPADPDFTAARVEVQLDWGLGRPEIGRITLTQPRVFGTLRGGELSFGELDPLIFTDSDEPPGLPDLDVVIRDGRGLLETDFGPIGIKVEGAGLVSNGFEGMLAVSAPDLAIGGCSIDDGSAYGSITTSLGKPAFDGPIRASSVLCPQSDLSVREIAVQVRASSDDTFAAFTGEGSLETSAARLATYAAAGSNGSVDAHWQGGVLSVQHTLAMRGVRTPQALAALLTLDGTFRANSGFEQVQMEGKLEGNGLRLGSSAESGIASLANLGEGTLIEPLARKFSAALQQQARGSAFEADFSARKTGDVLTVLAPQAELRGGGGARLASLSRIEFSTAGAGPARLSGNVSVGGAGLPQINGRMERAASGATVFRLAMQEYAAGDSALAIPDLRIAQSSNGALRFDGRVIADGPVPGGTTRGLRIPVSGSYAPGGAFALWSQCTPIGFDALQLADLRFQQGTVTVCPAGAGAIVRNGGAGMQVAGRIPSLDLAGTLGETAIRIGSGPVNIAYPGVMRASQVDIELGPEGAANRFAIGELDASFGDTVDGTFAQTDVDLDAIPFDIREARGSWAYIDGRFEISDGAFRLLDREEPDRFEPLLAREASLSLVDNVITAEADLRNPDSERLVTRVDIRHDLSSSTGYANLNVPGLRFDEQLQPSDLSSLALGVIANADGVVTGTGRIDWNGDDVTSSGEFSTDNLDFAAAFGPVRGASGTIVFDDLLSMTTAPNQTLRVAGINPGIEVTDGEVEFSLRDGQLLSVAGARFPFMGGELILRETDLNFGIEEERRYVFEIVGLDAGVFVERMEIGNLQATGLFDGTVPIVFNENGDGRIDGGLLISRPPGGNVSYVGELTYEDLSAIANFAFDALRSIDYSQMSLGMEGPLTGEIVTRVRFDGVKQGAGTQSNFVTRRLANLPLQFRVNVRAQFYKLLTSMKSLYDPASVRDPRELGLLSDDGVRLRREITGEEAERDLDPEDIIPDVPDTTQPIQDQESE